MINFNLDFLQTCSSTNDVAIKKAKEGFPEGSSYLAYLQTNGRGRNDNQWQSLEGNLFLSTIFRPVKNKNSWHQLSIIIGFSIIEILIKLGINKNEIELKWPNDVLVLDKKISGILLETFDNFIVAGVGLNINKNPQNDKKWNTTKLNDHTKNDYTNKFIANMLLKNIFKNYVIWQEQGFKFFKKKINHKIKNINKKIIVEFNSNLNNVSGIFLGLGDNGSLKIKVGEEYFEYYSVESFYFPDKELS